MRLDLNFKTNTQIGALGVLEGLKVPFWVPSKALLASRLEGLKVPFRAPLKAPLYFSLQEGFRGIETLNPKPIHESSFGEFWGSGLQGFQGLRAPVRDLEAFAKGLGVLACFFSWLGI